MHAFMFCELHKILPAEYPTESGILLRIKIFCCNYDGKMGDLEIPRQQLLKTKHLKNYSNQMVNIFTFLSAVGSCTSAVLM